MRLTRHLQPWQKAAEADDGLFERLCALAGDLLDEDWECWIEGVPGEFVVVVTRADASPTAAPFRYNGPDDAILRAFGDWLSRHGEGVSKPGVKGPHVGSTVGLTVIRELARPCPSCHGPFFEVEAQQEGSTEPFRYARCPRCEYGERLSPEDEQTAPDGGERRG